MLWMMKLLLRCILKYLHHYGVYMVMVVAGRVVVNPLLVAISEWPQEATW